MAEKKRVGRVFSEVMTPTQLKNRYLLKKFANGKCIRCTRPRDTNFATCSHCCAIRRARYPKRPKHSLREANGRFVKHG